MAIMSDHEHEPALPRDVKRLYDALENQRVQLNSALLSHLDRVIARRDFDKTHSKSTLTKIVLCRNPKVRLACFERFVDTKPECVGKAFLANLIIQFERYHLMPLVIERGLMPSEISDNSQMGVLLALHAQWSYPDHFCPQFLMREDRVKAWACMLFPQTTRELDTAVLARTVALPMHPDACRIMTDRLAQVGTGAYGQRKLADFLAREDGAMGGILLRAGLLDPQALLSDTDPHSPYLQSAIAEAQAWVIRQSTPSSQIKERRAIRL